MSDFWARKLAANSPQPQPRQQPVYTQNAWWDIPTPQQQPEPVPQAPAPTPAPTTTRAVSAATSDTCPHCISGNYFKPPGNPNAQTRCYDCGYPNLQSTSGAGFSTQNTGPATPSRQVSTANNFNPAMIVDRIG